MTDLLELQKLETSSDEVAVCAISWTSCHNDSCNEESFARD